MRKLVRDIALLVIGFAIGWSVAFSIAERHLDALERQHRSENVVRERMWQLHSVAPPPCVSDCGGAR